VFVVDLDSMLRQESILLRVQDTTGKGKQIGDGLRSQPKDDANECDNA